MNSIKTQTIHDMFDLYPEEDWQSIVFSITGELSQLPQQDDIAVKIGLDDESSIDKAELWFKRHKYDRLYLLYERGTRIFFPTSIVLAVKKSSYKDITKYFEAFGMKLRSFIHVEALKKFHEM